MADAKPLVGHRETWDDGGLICYCPIGRDHTVREALARTAAIEAAGGTPQCYHEDLNCPPGECDAMYAAHDGRDG